MPTSRIRDRDTAEVAVRAALVGRLLISTLHTNDTVAAVPHLVDADDGDRAAA